MKTIFIIILLVGLVFHGSAQEIPMAKLLQKVTPVEPFTATNDSLGEFRKSLRNFVRPFLEASGKLGTVMFSVCVSINSQGNVDTVFVSDNASPALKYHFGKFGNQLAIKELEKRTIAKKWSNAYIIFPILFLFEDPKENNFHSLVDHYAKNLLLANSFKALNLSSEPKPILMANLTGGVVGVTEY